MTSPSSAFISTTLHGSEQTKFFIDDPRDTIQAAIVQDGFYERLELEQICARVSSFDTVLDVGSNIGNHALYFARVAKCKLVYAIEPHPHALSLLKFNIALNDAHNIETKYLGLALGSQVKCGSIKECFSGNLGSSKTAEGGSVPIVPGDLLFRGTAIDFIKIDVEGDEIEVLVGLKDTIDRNQPTIFVEVDDENKMAFDRWRGHAKYSIKWRHRRYASNENFLIVPQ